MSVMKVVNKILGNFMVNLFLGSYIAFLVLSFYSNTIIISEYKDIIFLSVLVLVYLFFPLNYSWRRLKEELDPTTPVENDRHRGQTSIFMLLMLFFEPFVAAYVFIPLGAASGSHLVEFALFVAELIAYIPLVILYALISSKIREDRQKALDERKNMERRLKEEGSSKKALDDKAQEEAKVKALSNLNKKLVVNS